MDKERKKLAAWEARRSGARITVVGEFASEMTDDTFGSLTGVKAIRPIDGKVVAICEGGEEFELVV